MIPEGINRNVDNTDEGNIEGRLDRRLEGMRGVAGHDHEVGARRLETPRHRRQRRRRVLSAPQDGVLAIRDTRILVHEQVNVVLVLAGRPPAGSTTITPMIK